MGGLGTGQIVAVWVFRAPGCRDYFMDRQTIFGGKFLFPGMSRLLKP